MEVMGRYSNPCDQGERLRELLEMAPSGPPQPISRTRRQVQRRLREPEIKAVLASYLAGATVYELADQHGIHRHTVSEILERHGVVRRYQKLSVELVETASVLYQGGLSLTKIGVQLGLSAETVRQALMRAGLQIRSRRGWS